MTEDMIFSQNRTNKFIGCPRKFFYSYFTNYEKFPVDTTYARAGSAWHKTIELFWERTVEGDVDFFAYKDRLTQIFTETWDYSLPKKFLDVETPRILNNYLKWEKDQYSFYSKYNFKNYKPYNELHLVSQSQKLQAIIDLIRLTPNGKMMMVYDFKSNRKSKITDAMVIQANITAMVIESELKVAIPYVYFFFLQTGKILPVHVTSATKKHVRKQIDTIDKEVQRKILANEEFERKPSFMGCKWCGYKPYCEAREMGTNLKD